MDLTSINTTNNEEKSRFELVVEGHLAKIDYKIGRSGNMYMIHTEVPKDIGQKGVANKIVREALQWVDEHDIKIIPSCPYVRAYVKKNYEDYKHLLAEGVKLD